MAIAERWQTTPYDYARACALRRTLGVSHATATVLVRRGHDTPAAARRFLAADERHPPASFRGLDVACKLILDHVRRGSQIVVHGDYDVDGVCSTAVTVRALRHLGAQPRWHLPARSDGYGLSTATVQQLARDGARLLIAVDCAITAVDEIEEAHRLGLDVVVCDHHRPGERLPGCAIVHPAVCGYPCEELCATGVAHKLAECLLASAGAPARADDDLDLVALATVADVVPLVGENRRLVREGLAALARTRKAGLRALMKIAGVEPGVVDERAVGFRLAPRLNAAGRLARADAALELVLCEDDDRAHAVADELDLLNRERQDTETRILFAAEAARAEQPDSPVCVVAGDGWHPGVIGIVAGRLAERYHRPSVVIALDGEIGRGSARSISAYDLHAGLAACDQHLLRFGGHRAAAGLELERENLDAFRDALAAHARATLSDDDLQPVERVDAVISADAVGVELAEELRQLAPFGHGNPTPTLLVPAARVSDVRPMGDDGQHARFTISGGGGSARAVAFRTPARALVDGAGGRCDAAVRLELNEWRGAVEPRLVLRALCAAPGGRLEVVGEDDFWGLQREAGGFAPSHKTRAIVDHRVAGFAGVVGDLVATGDSVLIVCADTAQRSVALERVVPATADGTVGLAAWEALAHDPSLADPLTHVVALDPPESEERLALARSGGGFLHLAWGPLEVEFARGVATRELDLRPELSALYRELRDAGPLGGAALEAALRGDPKRPRSPWLCGRLLRVLCELDLIDLTGRGGEARCVVKDAVGRRDLERSAAYRACRARLAAVERHLAGALAPLEQAA